MAFAKIKAHLRRAVARTFDALSRALGSIGNLFNSEEHASRTAEARTGDRDIQAGGIASQADDDEGEQFKLLEVQTTLAK
jgi:hypothetical protein